MHWCLDHGAIAEDQQPDPYKNIPLLEMVAGRNTVDIFRLLRSRGAQLGPRTLHRAVGAAAGSSDDNERLPVRMAMVKYLVDELGLDVNAMDTEGTKPNHWGTPLCYAAQVAHGGEEVVRFLLDRGADPAIKDCFNFADAIWWSERKRNAPLAELLRGWKMQKSQDRE